MDYEQLVQVYNQLTSTTKRLEKTFILSGFIRTIPEKDADHVLLLLQGRVFPAWDQRTIGMASQLVVKALTTSSGLDSGRIDEIWKATGDLGETAKQVTKTKKQSTLFSNRLTTEKVFHNLQKLASVEGEGVVNVKMQLVAELLTSATPDEAKYLVRTVLEDLRIGLGEGTMRDAIVWAFFAEKTQLNYDKEKNEVNTNGEYEKYATAVQDAVNLTNDFALVVKAAKQGLPALEEINLVPGIPVKVMLFQKAKDIKEAFETVGKPAALEYKYDGFRCLIHKQGNRISLFTRRLEEVSKQFPEITEFVQQVKGDSFILDAEAIGYANNRYIPFQQISQRIKRKYEIAEMAKEFPVEVDVFDILYYEGKTLLKTPFSERRALLEKIITPVPRKIKLSELKVTENEEEAQEFYAKSIAAGNEGIMVKKLDGIYKAGLRVGYGVKVKAVMDTLDVVITGAEWGEGKRGQWLSSFIIAVRDSSGELLEIGRVGTGFKEKAEEGVTFAQITELLRPLIVKTEGRVVRVKPKIVLEVDYEEIQASPTYSSGYALRFPRFMRLREDRSVDDVSTLEDVEGLYHGQRGRGEEGL